MGRTAEVAAFADAEEAAGLAGVDCAPPCPAPAVRAAAWYLTELESRTDTVAPPFLCCGPVVPFVTTTLLPSAPAFKATPSPGSCSNFRFFTTCPSCARFIGVGVDGPEPLALLVCEKKQ